MREMKDSGIEWIGEIPDDWETKPLKSIVRFGKGLPITKENLIEQGIPVVNYGQIHSKLNNGTHLQKELIRFVSEQYLESNPTSLGKKGDIFFADTSEDYDGIGNAVLIDIDAPVFAGYHTVMVRPEDQLYSRYLAYLFLTDAWRSQLRSRASGIKVFSVTQGLLKKTTVILPPIEKIVSMTDYLDRKCSQIDAIIARQQEVIEKLKAYKLSVITEAVTKGLNPDVPMKDSGIKWISKIPEHWENRKMISILSMRVVDGPHESPELYDDGIPYISATAIENGKINFDLMRGYISEEYCDICDLRYKPQLYDILVIKLGASTGQAAIVETTKRFNIWVPLAAVRCNEEADPYFVYYAFQSDYFLKQMEMSWTYGTQQTLGVKTIERLRIMLPSLNEQKQIVCYLKSKCNSIDESITHKQNIIDKLTDYKKSLIYEVVTGKKEV